jgi:hypothetical protein
MLLGNATLGAAVSFQRSDPDLGLPSPGSRGIGVAHFGSATSIDLAVSAPAANLLRVLTGNGTGSFTAGPSFTVDNAPTALVVGDLNGDGLGDLVTARSTGTGISLLVNDGSGGTSRTDLATGNAPAAVVLFAESGSIPAIAVANAGDNSLAVIRRDGSGGYLSPDTYAVGTSPAAITAVDLNGDMHPDLVVANRDDNTVTVLRNGGNGIFTLAGTIAVGSGPGAIAAVTGNGGSLPDLAVVNGSGSSVTILRNQGDGSFVADTPLAIAGTPAGIAVGDFNRDGRPDLAIAVLSPPAPTSVTVLQFFLGTGTGGFVADGSQLVADGPAGVVSADLNADAVLDLATAASSANAASVLLNTAPPAPGLRLSPGSHNFGTLIVNPMNMPQGRQTFTVANSGTADLVVSQMAIATDPLNFSVVTGTGSNHCPDLTPTLVAGASCTVDVLFQPTYTGSLTGSLEVTANDTVTPTATAALSGLAVPLNTNLSLAYQGVGAATVSLLALPSETYQGSCGADCTIRVASTTEYAFRPIAATGCLVASWSGCKRLQTVAGVESCVVEALLDSSVTMTLATQLSPVRIAGTIPAYYSTLAAAYAAAPTGGTLQLMAAAFADSMDLNRDVAVTLAGGYDYLYGSASGTTALLGPVTVTAGSIAVDRIVIQ